MRSICRRHKPDDTLVFDSHVHKALNERAEAASSLRKVTSKFSDNHPPGRLGEILVGSFFEGAWPSSATGGQAGISARKKLPQIVSAEPDQMFGLETRSLKISNSQSISPQFRAYTFPYTFRPGPISGGGWGEAQAF